MMRQEIKKWGLLCAALGVFALGTSALAEGGPPGGAPPGPPPGAGGPPIGPMSATHPQFNPQMEKAMHDCMQEKGVKMPPPLTSAQQEVARKCAEKMRSGGGAKAFHDCMAKGGVVQPAPSEADRKSILECRQKVFGGNAPPAK